MPAQGLRTKRVGEILVRILVLCLVCTCSDRFYSNFKVAFFSVTPFLALVKSCNPSPLGERVAAKSVCTPADSASYRFFLRSGIYKKNINADGKQQVLEDKRTCFVIPIYTMPIDTTLQNNGGLKSYPRVEPNAWRGSISTKDMASW